MNRNEKKRSNLFSAKKGGLFFRKGQGGAFVLGAAAAGAAAAAMGIALAKRGAKAAKQEEAPVQARLLYRFPEEEPENR